MTKTVAVVGSGIAGPAAVIALARAGLKVHWVAPEPAPDHDPIGETLAPAANPILDRLGLAGIAAGGPHRQSHTTLSAWGGEQLIDRNAILHLEGAGLVLDRRRFEADLRAAATRSAPPIPVRLTDATAADGVWHLKLETGESLSADALVDASGRAAAVGRLHAERHRADQLVAAHAFLRQSDDTVEPTRAVLIEAVEQGWWYAALLPGDRLSVAFFTDPDLLGETPTRDVEIWRRMIAATRYVGRWIDDAGFAVEAPPRLASAGTAWLVPPAGLAGGAPWMAIGDGAAGFDPLSSHGMTTALWAGERSGVTLPAVLAGDAGALASYARAVLDGVRRFLDQRRQMYALEQRFSDAAFWQRRTRSADVFAR